MKKSIAALAVAMSSTSAFALIGPGHGPGGHHAPPAPQKTYCLSTYTSEEGVTTVGTCDATAKNQMFGATDLTEDGCTKDQAVMKTANAEIKIPSCPTFVQL